LKSESLVSGLEAKRLGAKWMDSGPFLLCARRFGACQDELDATVGWKERWIRWDLRLSGRQLAFSTSSGTRITITPMYAYHSSMIAENVPFYVSALYPTCISPAGYLCCRREVLLPGTTMMEQNHRVPSPTPFPWIHS
jgi:hypothetical protein